MYLFFIAYAFNNPKTMPRSMSRSSFLYVSCCLYNILMDKIKEVLKTTKPNVEKDKFKKF